MSVTTLATADGRSVPGYLAEPNSPRGGAIVLLAEWWGLNDQIKGVADSLAAEGYRVFVPDLYRGRVAQTPDEAKHLSTGLDFGNAAGHDVRVAAEVLSEGGTKVGVIGFCMGGSLALIAGAVVPKLSAVVTYYGIPPEGKAALSTIPVPVLGHFATRDGWCNKKLVGALEAELVAGGVGHTLFWYEADHAFFNQTRKPVYDEAAASLSWARTLAFFATYLVPQPE